MMREELTINKRRRRRQTLWRVSLCILSLLIIITLASVFYQYQKVPQHYPRLQTLTMRFAGWLTERKAHFHEEMLRRQAMVVVNPSALPKTDTAIQPHFEFYNMLSEEQDDDNVTMAPPSAPSQPADKKSHQVIAKTVISPNELKRDFADSLSKIKVN